MEKNVSNSSVEVSRHNCATTPLLCGILELLVLINDLNAVLKICFAILSGRRKMTVHIHLIRGGQ